MLDSVWGGGQGGSKKHKHGLPAGNITCKVAQVPPDLLHTHLWLKCHRKGIHIDIPV